MPDAEYLNRWEAGEVVTLAVALDLTQYLAKMEVAAAFSTAAPHLRELEADAAADAFIAGVRLGTKLAWRRPVVTASPSKRTTLKRPSRPESRRRWLRQG